MPVTYLVGDEVFMLGTDLVGEVIHPGFMGGAVTVEWANPDSGTPRLQFVDGRNICLVDEREYFRRL